MPWHIPVLIFLARICDVSIGTVRIILVIRGRKVIAAILGLFESIVWVLAVSQVIVHIHEGVVPVIAYGAGFATGTLIGMLIEQRLALGDQIIRAVNIDRSVNLASILRQFNLRVTQVVGRGITGPVEIDLLLVPRRQTRETVDLILEHCPKAFVSVEDVRDASSTFIRETRSRTPGWLRLIKFK